MSLWIPLLAVLVYCAARMFFHTGAGIEPRDKTDAMLWRDRLVDDYLSLRSEFVAAVFVMVAAYALHLGHWVLEQINNPLGADSPAAVDTDAP